MSLRRVSTMIAAAALLSAAAGVAHAADKPRPVDFTVHAEPTTVAPNGGQALRFDAIKGRFGFTINVTQPGERPAVANDIQAGAFFRITPSLRVGGSVAFGDQDLTPRASPARPADAPKVRLESTFKF